MTTFLNLTGKVSHHHSIINCQYDMSNVRKDASAFHEIVRDWMGEKGLSKGQTLIKGVVIPEMDREEARRLAVTLTLKLGLTTFVVRDSKVCRL